MSVVHRNLRRDAGRSETWYLRMPDGSVFGPVDLATLCRWSAQSRIAPGNEISDDEENWFPAEDLPELKMEWMAETPVGETLGPFNVLAVPHLFNDGVLPADAKIINRLSGKTLQVHELLKTSGVAPIDMQELAPSEESETKAKQLAVEKERNWENRYRDEKKVRLREVAAMQGAVDDARKQLETATANVGRHKAVRGKDRELTQQLTQLRSKLSSTDRELEQTKRRLSEATDRSKAQQREAEDKLVRLKSDIERQKSLNVEVQKGGSKKEAALVKEVRAVQEAASKAESELTELKKQHDSLEMAARQTKEDLSYRVDQLQEAERDAAKTISNLEKELDERTGKFEQLETSASTADSGLADIKAELEQLRAHYDPLQEEAKKQFEALEASTAELQKEQTLHAQTRSRLEDDAKDLGKKTSALERDLKSVTSKLQAAEGKLAEQSETNQAVRKDSSEQEKLLKKEITDLTKQLKAATANVDGHQKQLDQLRKDGETGLSRAADKEERLLEKSETQKKEFQFQLERARDDEKALKDRVVSLEEELESGAALIVEHRDKLEATDKHTQDLLARETSGLSVQLGQKEEALAKAQADLKALSERSANEQAEQKQRVDRLETDLDQATERGARLQKEVDEGTTLHTDLASSSSAKEQELRAEQDRVEKRLAEKEGEFAGLQDQMAEQQSSADSRLQSQRDDSESRTAELSEALADSKERLASLEEEIYDERSKRIDLDTSLSAKEKSFRADMERLESQIRDQNKGLEADHSASEKEITGLKNSLLAETERSLQLSEEIESERKQRHELSAAASDDEKASQAKIQQLESLVKDREDQLTGQREELEARAADFEMKIGAQRKKAKEEAERAEQLDEQLEAARTQHAEAKQELSETVESLRIDIERLGAASSDKDSELATHRSDHAAQIEELKEKLSAAAERTEGTAAELSRAEESLRAAEDNAGEKETSLRDRIDELQTQLASKNEKLEEEHVRFLELRQDTTGAREEIEKKVVSLEESLAASTDLLETSKTSEGSLGHDVEELEQRLSQRDAELSTLQSQHDDLDKQALDTRTELQDKIIELTESADNISSEAKAAAVENTALRTTLDETRAEFASQRSRYEERTAQLEGSISSQTDLASQTKKDIEKIKGLHADAVAAAADKEADLARQIKELQTTVGAGREEFRQQTVLYKDLENEAVEAHKRHTDEVAALKESLAISSSEGEAGKALLAKSDELSAELSNARAQIQKLTEELEAERSTSADVSVSSAEQRDVLQTDIEDLRLQFDAKERELADGAARFLALEQENNDLRAKCERMSTSAGNSSSELQKIEALLETEKSRSGGIEKHAAEAQAGLSVELDVLRQSLADVEGELARQKESNESLQEQNTSAVQELEDHKRHALADGDDSVETIEGLNRQLAKHRDAYRELLAQATTAGREVEKAKSELTELRGYYESLVKRTQKQERALLKKVEKLESEKIKSEKRESEKPKSVEPRKSMSERMALIGSGMRAGVVELDHVLRSSPSFTKTAVFAAVLIMACIVSFLIGNIGRGLPAETTDEIVASGAPIEQIDDEPAVLIASTDLTPREPEPISMELDTELDLPLVTDTILEEAAEELSWPDIDVPGTLVVYTDEAYMIVFEKGIFDYMTHFGEGSLDSLYQVASQLRSHMSDFTLIIEGHTDSVPMSGTAAFGNNDDLALARANAVLNVLKDRFRMPASSMLAIAAGRAPSPYPNDAANKKKNRTVVLKLFLR